MATVQATLTPKTDTAPAVVSIPAKELSGEQWVGRFPRSKSISDLTPQFGAAVAAFKAALEAGGASVDIANTFRPPESCYLMHWAHEIARNGYSSARVPTMAGVNIEWVHKTPAASLAAAQDMVIGYGIGHLAANTPPALDSLHSHRQAVDMTIAWTHNLAIAKQDGTIVTITSTPRTGMNAELKAIGRTYGVIKYVGGEADKPHWSTTGN